MSVMGQRKDWGCCQARRSRRKTSELSYRILWELLRGGYIATRCLKTPHVPLGSSGGKISSRDLREGPYRKVVCQKGQQKCLYTKASSTGNKHEKLEIMMCLENYDRVAIIEI